MPAINTYNNYIDGSWEEPTTGEYLERKSPLNGEVTSRYPGSGEQDVKEAIEAAENSFRNGPWRNLSPSDKGRIMITIAEKLEEKSQELGQIETYENGKIYRNSVGEIKKAADYFRFYAGVIRNIHGDWYEPAPNVRCFVSMDPIGVCTLIVPWNSPLDLLTRKLAPAIAAGCSVVIKPSSLTPGITMAFLKAIHETGLIPKGVINAVTGSGRSIGDILVTDQRVRKIAFTGSTAVGENIMKLASKGVKRVSLELGGKSPNVVFEDADLDKALPAAFWALFRNAGQSCSAGSRLLVHENIHDSFISKLADFASNIKVGDPFDSSSDYGPVVSDSQMEQIQDFIAEASGSGIKSVIGGNRLLENNLRNGLYLEPTIFDNVQSDERIFQDEIFGPVLTVTQFSSDEEAIDIANATRYGLEAGIWTRDINRALRVAKGIDSGNISINNYQLRFTEVPFGGHRESGIGKELSMHGIDEYLETKSVCIDLEDSFHQKAH